ncbi:AAEL013257-PA [Aedes aegypti]|uniref:AAEL013257-PA n=1 Tax=Aedes aegypti TaxID=7159 RepID=Q16JQ0_AEDAE|nr:AAEL013257-PA [Aedes aegypti]
MSHFFFSQQAEMIHAANGGDTFYDLDRIYATVERMLVLIRQLSGVSRLGESGRSMSVELQLLNAIDDRGYQLQELQDAVQYLFSQFRKIYLVNKDLYVQLNKRGGRVFELEKQFREQEDGSKCLYYMADVIKYEPALLAMQRVLDRTMREIRIFRKQRNKHKLELCVSHIRNENYDKAFDEFFSFEDNIEQLPQIVEGVFERSTTNLMKMLLFLKGYFSLHKPNSGETFVAGCEHIVQHLKRSVMFCRVETLMIYSTITEVQKEVPHLEDFFQNRLDLLLIDLSANKELAVQMILTDPDEAVNFAKLFNHMSDDLLLELIRETYQGSSKNLRLTLKFISDLPCVNQQILSYQEVHNEMRRLGQSKSSCIFVFAYHIKITMQNPKFLHATRSPELDDLKAILPPNVVSIIWRQVSISRYESRILMKCGAVGKEVGFSRYTADKNRFECEPVDEGEAFRIRAIAVHGYLVEQDRRPVIVSTKCDTSCASGHWRLIPHDDCSYFRIQNVDSGRFLYSKFSESADYDFYNSPEVLKLSAEESVLNESNSYWKVGEFIRGTRGDTDCTIL